MQAQILLLSESAFSNICISLHANYLNNSSTCAIIYHLARNRHVQEKLHKELDETLGTEDETVATGQQVKNLPFLDACINEGLRIHSTSAIGLPRVVPEGGLTVLGQFFPEGTVLSVPSYSIHRDRTVWGDDVDAYRPERWFEGDVAAMQKTFNPFSVGPRYLAFSITWDFIFKPFLCRACVGRNLAFLELQIIVASIMRRYDIVLENPDLPVSIKVEQAVFITLTLCFLASNSRRFPPKTAWLQSRY